LLSGKLSQTNQTLRVIRSTARTFEPAQWEVLENRLLAWKTGLASVLDVVAAARKRSEPSPQVPPAATTAMSSTQNQAEPLAA
jgi:translation initiation factor 3 subunit M